MKTTNYYNTFIAVAEDCPVQNAEVPPLRSTGKSVANLQFETIIDNPYQYTSDDVLFAIFAIKNNIRKQDYEQERAHYFSEGQACLRCSPLSKRYGWGVHNNQEGKVAIYPVESEEYKKLSKDSTLTQVKAMRSKKK